MPNLAATLRAHESPAALRSSFSGTLNGQLSLAAGPGTPTTSAVSFGTNSGWITLATADATAVSSLPVTVELWVWISGGSGQQKSMVSTKSTTGHRG